MIALICGLVLLALLIYFAWMYKAVAEENE